MKLSRKLLLVFALVFSLTFVAGGLLSTQANAQCGLNGCGWFPNMAFFNAGCGYCGAPGYIQTCNRPVPRHIVEYGSPD